MRRWTRVERQDTTRERNGKVEIGHGALSKQICCVLCLFRSDFFFDPAGAACVTMANVVMLRSNQATVPTGTQ
jgi:hypothetical protein